MSLYVVAASLVAAQQLPARRGHSSSDAVRFGSLSGRVRLLTTGTVIPHATAVENVTDPEVCGRDHTLEDLLVSARTRGLQNVILSVRGVPTERLPRLEPGRLVIDNVKCRFSPHASVLTVGSTVEALNSDPVLHTTHLYGPTEFNIALPSEGSRVARVVKSAGMIVVKCDIHSWMQAFIRVDPHPFHAVSDSEGVFRIDAIPAGDYVLEAWHERLGPRKVPVRIQAGMAETVEIDYHLEGDPP